MRSSFRQIWSRFARTVLARASQRRRRKRPGLRTRLATEVLESRQLLSSRVADVLKGTTDTMITGTVYEDVNSDGVRNNGENGVPGWRVYLDLDNSGTYNQDVDGAWEPSSLTNVDGDFKINKLVAGTYRIAEVVQAGPRSALGADE